MAKKILKIRAPKKAINPCVRCEELRRQIQEMAIKRDLAIITLESGLSVTEWAKTAGGDGNVAPAIVQSAIRILRGDAAPKGLVS